VNENNKFLKAITVYLFSRVLVSRVAAQTTTETTAETHGEDKI
jgi:hypothetical protein